MDICDILTKVSSTIIVVMPNLDNGIPGIAGILNAERGVCDNMPKRLRERVQIGLKETGEPEYKWATGWTNQELQADIAKIVVEAGLIQGISPITEKEPSITVREFVEKTFMPTFTRHLAPTTQENYRLFLELNILPFMGDMPMNNVTVATIQQFYDWMASASTRGRKKNINARSIERISGFASRIFKVALEMKVIDETPFKKTLLKIHAEEAGHHIALPDDLVARVKQHIPLLEDRDERVYMGLLAFTGMRPEEVRGLSWEDIDLEQQYGRIVKAVTYPQNSKAHVGRPKTDHSNRTVLLPKPLISILQLEAKKSGYICGGEEPWCYSTATRISNRAFKHLGIKGYTDYDFRSTFGTQLKEMGVSSAQVADILGHGDTRMVETVYARTRHNGVMKMLETVERLTISGS